MIYFRALFLFSLRGSASPRVYLPLETILKVQLDLLLVKKSEGVVVLRSQIVADILPQDA
jgi:hypothetical protein